MPLNEHFLYTRVLETDGQVTSKLTFAGAMLALIGIIAALLLIAVPLFFVLSKI